MFQFQLPSELLEKRTEKSYMTMINLLLHWSTLMLIVVNVTAEFWFCLFVLFCCACLIFYRIHLRWIKDVYIDTVSGMEPAFANHPTGLLIANPGLPHEPAIGLLPPLLLACSAPYSSAFGSLPQLYWFVCCPAPTSDPLLTPASFPTRCCALPTVHRTKSDPFKANKLQFQVWHWRFLYTHLSTSLPYPPLYGGPYYGAPTGGLRLWSRRVWRSIHITA